MKTETMADTGQDIIIAPRAHKILKKHHFLRVEKFY